MFSRSSTVMILVLNWNGWRDTLDCLESLYNNDYPDYQVVLIDNDSTDDSLERIREWASHSFSHCPLPYIAYDRITAERGGLKEDELRLYCELPAQIPHPLIIIQAGENLGFAGGNNVGLRYALSRDAGYVLLLNNDAQLRSPQVLTTMIEFMASHPDAGACGGRLFFPDGTLQSSYGSFPSLPRALAFLFPLYRLLPKVLLRHFKRANVIPDASISEPLAVDYPSGACMLVRNAVLTEVGLLDERFFMYAEETDWCLRMMKCGWNRYYLPQAEVVHKCAGSFTNAEPALNHYFVVSLFKYYRKNFSNLHLWIVTTGYVLRSLYSILHWTIAAHIGPEPLRLKARNQTQQWQLSLQLALATLKDLFTGNIFSDQQRHRPEEVR